MRLTKQDVTKGLRMTSATLPAFTKGIDNAPVRYGEPLPPVAPSLAEIRVRIEAAQQRLNEIAATARKATR